MKYIFSKIMIGVFLFLTIGILINNLMDTYSTTIDSFPLILFICFAFTLIAIFSYDILILSENIVLLNRNTEITKNNSKLTKEDRQLKNIIDALLIILHASYLGALINASFQIESIYFFIIQYVLFIITNILLRIRICRNIKLRRLLRNNETISKHLRPL